MQTIVKLDILYNEEVFEVEFLSCHDSYIRKNLGKEIDKNFSFSLFIEFELKKKEINEKLEEYWEKIALDDSEYITMRQTQ